MPKKWRALFRVTSLGEGFIRVMVPARQSHAAYKIPKPPFKVKVGDRFHAYCHLNEGTRLEPERLERS